MVELSKDTVRSLIAIAEDNLSRLLSEKRAIEEKIKDTADRIGELKRSVDGISSQQVTKGRKQKGQNLSDIRAFFESQPKGSTFTVKDISERTGIKWSSVRTVLVKNNEVFCSTQSGEYGLAEER
jgi:cell division septum initiation protein DivIVA